ncbi:IS30 family transposase, partial [Enterococcus malodoratus]
TDEFIEQFVDKMNLRPRKCLGWKTPYEVFYDKVLHLI